MNPKFNLYTRFKNTDTGIKKFISERFMPMLSNGWGAR